MNKIYPLILLIVLLNLVNSQKNIVGGWEDLNPKLITPKLRELIQFGLQSIKLINVYEMQSLEFFQKQIVSGTNYKISFVANPKSEQKEKEKVLIYFQIHESLNADNFNLIQHFIFTQDDEFQPVADEVIQNQLYQYVKNYVRPEESKVARKNFVFQKQTEKGIIYLIGADIQKIVKNRNDKTEFWLLVDHNDQYTPLFFKRFHSKNSKMTSKQITGNCPDVGSYFVCAMRHNCTTQLYQTHLQCSDLRRIDDEL